MFRKIFKHYFETLNHVSMELNFQNIASQLHNDKNVNLLDLGCNDGGRTLKYAQRIGTRDVSGIEIVRKQANKAGRKGIKVKVGDLNKKWPFKNDFFDVLIANQVIEHLTNIDHFLSEVKRVLKKGGYVIISTENGSSWHNIFASILGWQIFSLTNVSSLEGGIGNPLALHRKEKPRFSSWTHKTIYNYQGLKEIIEIYGFTIESCLGSGYHPFPPYLALLDPIHSHYLSIKARKVYLLLFIKLS